VGMSLFTFFPMQKPFFGGKYQYNIYDAAKVGSSPPKVIQNCEDAVPLMLRNRSFSPGSNCGYSWVCSPLFNFKNYYPEKGVNEDDLEDENFTSAGNLKHQEINGKL
jgi:hypothetical protein